MQQFIQRVAFTLLATGAIATGVQAQSIRNINDCEVLVLGDFIKIGEGGFFKSGVMNTCAAADLSRVRTIYVPQVVQRAIRNSFGFRPGSIAPAGISGLIAGEAENRLSSSAMVISPTADISTVAPVAPAKWNTWVDGRYLWNDYSNSAGDLDGPTWTGMAGLDYKITDKITLGLLVSADGSELGSAATDFDSTSIGVGPYLGIVLTDNIVFSSNLLGSWIDSEQAGGLLEYETTRIQASAAVNGYWFNGTWRFNPGLTLSWSKDWEEETNGLFPDRTIVVGVLTPSFQLGNTLRLSDTTTVEPWVGASLDWTFQSETHTSGLNTVSDPSTDLRLLAGFNFGFGNNAQLSLTGEASGLLLDDLTAYSVAANFAVQF